MFESLVIAVAYFLLSFSILSFIRLGSNFISSLLSNPPKPLVLNNRELIYHGLTISYIITFFIILLR